MNINDVISFIRVVRSGGFESASRQFGTPKSTLSRQIKNLEQRLGVTLLQRTTRRVSMTPAGESLYLKTSNLLEQINEAEAELKTEIQGMTGRVRITAPLDMGPELLAKPLSRFMKEHPHVHFEIQLTDRVVDLIGERVDLGIRAGELKSSELKSRKLGESRMILVASPGFQQKYPKLAHPADLAEVPTIVFSPELAPRPWVLVSQKKRAELRPSTGQTVSNFAMCLALARQGCGVTLLPKFVVQDDLVTGELVRVLPEWSTELRSIHLVWPPHRVLPARLRMVIDFLSSQRLIEGVEN